MAWDFETDPEFQKKLDWIEEFMAEEVEPLSHLGMAVYGRVGRDKFIKPLQQKVRDQKLWACHLGPELGGQGYGQLKLGLMNEKLGRNGLAPPSSAARRRTAATPRSSPTTAPTRRRRRTSGRS